VKKLFLLLFLLLYSVFSFSQDIVYDSLIGNRNYWRRIKVGPDEKILNIYYQNIGIISKSKILMAAGIWDGISEHIDYEIRSLNYDTVTFEFKTDKPMNLIFYKYQYNETYHFNFLGFRRASLGDDMFMGQYLFVCPIDTGALVSIYKGIGNNRKLFMSFKGSEMNKPGYVYTDYNVDNEMTVKVIHGQRKILHVIIKQLIIDENDLESRIVIWPNPASNYVNISIYENTGAIIRVYNYSGMLIYTTLMNEDQITIDVSKFKSGMYTFVFSDPKYGNILYTHKVIIN